MSATSEPRRVLPGTSDEDEKLLYEIQERFDYATSEWRDIRTAASEDMRAVAGDPWNPTDRKNRADAGRPCLSLDELNQYCNQVIADVLQNQRSIKVTPLGNGATDKTAEARANLVRQIEYRSNAQMGYVTMFENALQRSYGYVRVKPRYESDRSFDQELSIEAVVNPDTVLPDPDAKQPDLSDMRYCFVLEKWSRREFERQFPKAKTSSFSGMDAFYLPQWVNGDQLTVAEYWTIQKSPDTLYLIQADGVAKPLSMLRSELEAKGAEIDEKAKRILVDGVTLTIINQRPTERPKVMQYLTNGVEILSRTEWPGKFIPIAACLGKVVYVDDGSGSKRKLLSLIRLARDPFMLYCYIRTCEAEVIGGVPRNAWIGYKGQFDGVGDTWQRAAHEPLVYLEANATTDATGNEVLPLPQRQPWDPPLQNLELAAESARRAIQAAIGILPLPSEAQIQDQRSGRAMGKLTDTAQRGAYHFIAHFDQSIRRVGEIIDDLIPHYYDTSKDITVRTPAGEPQMLRVNDPNAVDPQTQEANAIMLTEGTHDVTISTGPSFDSEREQANEFADLLAGNPQVFPLVGDLVVKLKNLGPIGDEIAERLQFLLPPELRAQVTGQQAQQDPQQMAAQLQLLQGQLQQATQIITGKQVEAQAELQKAQLDAETRIKVAEIQAQSKLVGDELKAGTAEVQRRIDLLETMIQAEREARLQARQHGHELGMKAADRLVAATAVETANQVAQPQTGA